MANYKVFDIFSGAGGMAEGFIRAGFNVLYATDISKYASETYINRHKQLGLELNYYCGDINNLSSEQSLKDFLKDDINNIDVICGGPPCQGFSTAGKRDSEDPRNKLVFNYLQIIKLVKPKYFVFENVIGILSTICNVYKSEDNSEYINQPVIDLLISEFRLIGYTANYKILEAKDFGVPQKRKRVIILGQKISESISNVEFPEGTEKNMITVYDAISDLENIYTNEKVNHYNLEFFSDYQNQSREGRTKSLKIQNLENHITSNHSAKTIRRFQLLKEGENIKSFLKRMNIKEGDDLFTKKNNCRKLERNYLSPTITTLPDDIVHYSKNRILTVREMARLQSFDDSFVFYGKRTTGGKLRKLETPQYTQVGNAVPPLLAYAIASQILKALNESQ